MKRNDFLTLIETMLEEDPGSLSGNEPLDSIRWDSLAVVSFISLADEHLGAAVSPSELAKARNLSDVLSLVANRLE
jgi:acyl carrier protein